MKIKILKLILLLSSFAGLIYSIILRNHFYIVVSLTAFLYILRLLKKWKITIKGQAFTLRSFASLDIFLFLFLIFFLRLYKIQIIDHEKYQASVKDQIESTFTLEGKRGSIFDASGSEIAYDSSIYKISLDPLKLYISEDLEKILTELNEILSISPKNKLTSKEIINLGQKKRRYKLIDDKANEIETDKLRKLIKTYNLRSHEIVISESKERRYVNRELYKDLLGTLGYSDSGEKLTGISGIEKEYEEDLKGQTLKVKNAFMKNRAYTLPTTNERILFSPSGKNVHLTINKDIQYIFNDEIKKQFEATLAEEAYGVVVNPNTGAILAISSFKRNSNIIKNPIFQNQIEPGSILKPLVLSQLIEDNYVTEDSIFDLGNGTIRKYGYTIKEASFSVKGEMSVRDILARSSNVGMVLMSDFITDEIMEGYLKEFGFYEKTGVDFPYEIKPYTTPSNKWDGLKRNTISFGQGIVVTPIQMIMAYSSLVNGGKLYKPYIVDKITDENNEYVIRRNTPLAVASPITEETSAKMKLLLENVVAEGGGKKAFLPGYKIAGKTGTAQISGGKSGYLKNEYLTSFIGSFPADKPEYAALITLYKPQAEYKLGGVLAAPIFKDFIRRLTLTKNIDSEELTPVTFISTTEKENQVTLPRTTYITMPDISGLTLREVTDLFSGNAIDLKISGTGKVKKFLPEKDTNLENIQLIEIILE